MEDREFIDDDGVRSPPGWVDATKRLHELDSDGWTIVPDVISASACEEMVSILDRLWIDEPNRRSIAGDEPHVRFVGHLLQHSPIFQNCVTDERVLACARRLLGDDLRLFQMSGRSVDPCGGPQPWHDLSRRRGRPFEKCNVIVCLDEYSASNGALQVAPGTHLGDEQFLAEMSHPMKPHPAEVLVMAPRCSAIVSNGHLIHRGSLNASDRPRHAVLVAYTASYTDPHNDWSMIPDEVFRHLRPEMIGLIHPASDRQPV